MGWGNGIRKSPRGDLNLTLDLGRYRYPGGANPGTGGEVVVTVGERIELCNVRATKGKVNVLMDLEETSVSEAPYDNEDGIYERDDRQCTDGGRVGSLESSRQCDVCPEGTVVNQKYIPRYLR